MAKRVVSKHHSRVNALIKRSLAERGGQSLEQVKREVSNRERQLKQGKQKEILSLRGKVKWEGNLAALRRRRKLPK